ncbi:hypothetical protein [Flavobacterium panacagri]|uniref:hypothetical protein n=1 Tax=Flavobacterium panacagri TaxID=3034146 RepID=UPI0025A5C2E4|nr:hypothetical protein [Flavobacterium panacagri]
MIKKFILLSLVASQLMTSCSSDESNDKPETEQTVEEQIAELLKKPYSSLTPAQQKTKLEAEANEMLTQLDKTKSSSAIEALENLSRLLNVDQIDIFAGKNNNEVEDILNISGVYGVYTWNNTSQTWAKTASTTELKFVFPAKKSQTANNAVLSSKGVSSDIKVKKFDGWANSANGDVRIYDSIFLPTSSDAVLTIDNKESATFTQTAKYANGKEIPTEFAYKMTLNDGYTWEMSSLKAATNNAKAVLTYNGKTLIDFNAGSNTEIDKLIEDAKLVQYRGKANGLFKLMDNFVIIADMDLATAAADDIALEKSLLKVEHNKDYYTNSNIYNLKVSEGKAANFNKNSKLILVSKKDGTKIADIVLRSEKEYSYSLNYKWVIDSNNNNGGYWTYDNSAPEIIANYYYEVYYLKFNDNTEAEMGAYFSEGFEKFEAKFEDFIKAFEK